MGYGTRGVGTTMGYGIRSVPTTMGYGTRSVVTAYGVCLLLCAYYLKKLKPGCNAYRNIRKHNRLNSSRMPVFGGETPKSGGLCEIFHKKRLDRSVYLLYYRVSLLL